MTPGRKYLRHRSPCAAVRLLGWLIAALSGLSLLSAEEPAARLGNRQIVLETSAGSIVLEVYPLAAPNHVQKFLERVANHFYEGTIFHRAIPGGIIQGGDPLTKDPSKRTLYGTGGLQELKFEANPLPLTRGAMAAVLIPNQRDSAGSQFFICVHDQVQLNGQYTVFGQVAEGMEVVSAISTRPTDKDQKLEERVVLLKTYLRDRPAPEVIPFTDTPAGELSKYGARIQTDFGDIEVRFFAEDAPEHVRQFLRFAQLGLYNGTLFQRVVPKFVIQGGLLASREPAAPEKYKPLLRALHAEINAHKHERGILSMARGEDPHSGMDSFFIVLDSQPHLDDNYTVFGYVTKGMEVADSISAVELKEESPVKPVRLRIEVIQP
jgi:cyclophilin family peptidyl-prolyl cis-trans isomerase